MGSSILIYEKVKLIIKSLKWPYLLVGEQDGSWVVQGDEVQLFGERVLPLELVLASLLAGVG